MNELTQLLGVDVGTSRIKAVVYDLSGTVRSSAECSTPWRDGPYGVEMDVTDLSTAVHRVLREASGGSAQIAGIGVTGVGESGVLTPADGRTALAPIRAWHNMRGDVDRVRARCDESTFRRTTGLPLDAKASLPKILQAHVDHPRSRDATRFYSVPEWVIRDLGGDPGSELSLASRTGMFDVLAGAPWPLAIELVGGVNLLGEPQLAGALCGHAGRLPGLEHLAGAALVVGGHDHQTAALAAGATRPGTLFDSLGTAEAILRYTDLAMSPATIESFVCAGFGVGRAVVADRLCVMGGRETGMQLEHLAQSLGATDREARHRLADDPRWMTGVEQIVGSADPLLRALRDALGDHRDVLVAGGWLHDEQVRAAKQRQLGAFSGSFVDEAGAVGAAYLAGVAAGLLPSLQEAGGPLWG